MYLYATEFSHGTDSMQKEEFDLKHANKTAQHLRFTVLSAYDHFVAVYRVHVDGTAVHGT